MQIDITGHGIEITPALRSYTNEKLDRLKRRVDQITSIHVIFGVEKLQQIAKATVHVYGNDIHARSESADLYSAIDSLVDKLTQQVTKHKEKLKDHHGKDKIDLDGE